MPPIEGTLLERLGIDVLEATAARVVATMPVEGNTQPFGYLHGGATAALCETVASIGALLGGGGGHSAAGIEINVSHLRSVRSGIVTATAVPVKQGSSIAVWAVSVVDEDDGTVAVSTATLAIRES